MPKRYEDFTTDEHGDEHHPAFGMARFNRIYSNPGAVLFQSDLHHQEYIEVTLSAATRKRDLKTDRVHAGKTLVKFAMSMAQFASFMASGGTEGVPVTIGYDHGDVPGLVMAPRLAVTTSEVRAAAHEAYAAIQRAEAEYWAAADARPPVPAAERKRLRANLQAAIRNAAPNVEYAAKQLTEHAEAVVEMSRADIEAMVASAQGKQGQAALAAPVTSITEGPGGEPE
jgi:hypothetical protein